MDCLVPSHSMPHTYLMYLTVCLMFASCSLTDCLVFTMCCLLIASCLLIDRLVYITQHITHVLRQHFPIDS